MNDLILLVRPPFRDPLAYKPQPMGLCCLGGHLRAQRPSLRVEVLDAVALELDVPAVVEEVIARRPSVLGLTLKTPQAPYAYAIATEVKRRAGIPVVMGGNHVTVMPEEALAGGADIVVIGEGEVTFLEVVDRLLANEVAGGPPPGAAWLVDGRMVRGGTRALASLDDLSPPDWSLLDLSRYNENIHIHHRPALQVMASRGCPFSCTFCSTYLTWTNRMRWRSPRGVVAELRSGLEESNHSVFHFYDDDILEDAKWLAEFLDELEAARLPIEWHGIVRVGNVLRCEHLLERARRAGCRGFAFGFEAGNDDIYRRQRKGMTLSTTMRAAKMIHDYGFDLVEPLLMNMYPGETVETMVASAQTVLSLRAEMGIHYHTSRYFATPYPGTAFYESHAKEGMLLARGWEEHFTHFANFIPFSFLESPVSGTRLDTRRYRLLFRMHFTTYGDFNRYLEADEMRDFMGGVDEERLLEELSRLLPVSRDFADFVRRSRPVTGLSEVSSYEFCAKLLVHAASFSLLTQTSEAGVAERAYS